MRLYLMFLCLGLAHNYMSAQGSTMVQLNFIPAHGDFPVWKDSDESAVTSSGFRLDVLKFYVGQIGFWKRGKQVYVDDRTKLIDFESGIKNSVQIKKPSAFTFDSISFLLGVDSLTNAQGVKGNDLDPIKGMYWTWESGYINFKCEGTFGEKSFKWHLGGYRGGLNNAKKLGFSVTHREVINVKLRLENMLTHLLEADHLTVMTPGEYSDELSRLIARSFEVEH